MCEERERCRDLSSGTRKMHVAKIEPCSLTPFFFWRGKGSFLDPTCKNQSQNPCAFLLRVCVFRQKVLWKSLKSLNLRVLHSKEHFGCERDLRLSAMQNHGAGFEDIEAFYMCVCSVLLRVWKAAAAELVSKSSVCPGCPLTSDISGGCLQGSS